MRRALSKKLLALIFVVSLLTAIQLNSATHSLRTTLSEHGAAVSGEYASVYVMPSRLTAMIGVCFRNQRLTVRGPSIFGFYRARCISGDGWIHREEIRLTD